MLITTALTKTKTHYTILLLLFIGIFLWVPMVQAKNTAVNHVSNPSSYSKDVFSAERLAKELTKATGIAWNPVLCVATLGWYKWGSASEIERQNHPWHYSPWFWGPLMGILLLIFLKNCFKIVVPAALAGPADVIQHLFVKSPSAALGIPVLILEITHGNFKQTELLSQYISDFLFPVAFAGDSLNAMVLTTGSTFVIILIPVLLVFTTVWVMSQAINVLILICPVAKLDVLLVATKNMFLIMLLGAYISPYPYIALLFALPIILLSMYLFQKGLRLIIFGTIMSYDILVFKIFNKSVTKSFPGKRIQSFSNCYFSDVPSLTYGEIFQKNGTIHFTYRSYFILKKRTLDTRIRTSDCELEDEFTSLVLNQKTIDQDKELQLFRLRSMYDQFYEKSADTLGVRLAEKDSLMQEIKEGWEWIRSLFTKTPRLSATKIS